MILETHNTTFTGFAVKGRVASFTPTDFGLDRIRQMTWYRHRGTLVFRSGHGKD